VHIWKYLITPLNRRGNLYFDFKKNNVLIVSMVRKNFQDGRMTFFRYLNFAKKLYCSNLKKLEHPYKIFLVVTKSCQSRCLNCHIWKEIPKNELTLFEYELIAKNLNSHLSWLNISGGEPTVTLLNSNS